MKASDQALILCQKIGCSTMFGNFNSGMSLPLEVSKKIAIICLEEICPSSSYKDFEDIINEIKLL